MSNWYVKWAVERALHDVVRDTVRDEVRRTVGWSMNGALRVSLFWPVKGAVGWALNEDLPHPALQEFLREAL
jgi:hypothetical protein